MVPGREGEGGGAKRGGTWIRLIGIIRHMGGAHMLVGHMHASHLHAEEC